MKRVLVIGANGFTGRSVLEHLSLSGQYILFALSLSDDITPNSQYKYSFTKGNICNFEWFNDYFRKLSPDVIINCSAISVPDFCENNRDIALLCNNTAVKNIATQAKLIGCKVIHLSTDFVFDGKKGSKYIECDTPSPVNYYGYTKMMGERALMESGCNYIIARVILIYGATYPGQHGNIVNLVYNKLSKGEPINVVCDQWRTPVYVKDIAMAMDSFINSSCTGIFHIAGQECLSISQIAYRVADIMDLDSSLINELTTAQMNEKIARPLFSCLDISKAQNEIDFNPTPFDIGVRKSFNID